MTTHVIVGCGKKKAPGKVEARDKYTSPYATVKARFAETIGDSWSILSAKYGIIEPDRVIDDYDVTASDVDDVAFRSLVSNTTSVIPDDTTHLIVCAGRDYTDPIRHLLRGQANDVEYFFDGTSGMGDQMRKMNEAVEAAKNEDLNQYV